METTVDEIATDIYRLSTWIPEHGFTSTSSCSPATRRSVPLPSAAVVSAGVGGRQPGRPGDLEADECGAMNLFVDAAPGAEVIQGPLACTLSLIDMCDRPPIAANIEPGAVHDIGGWEAGLWFDETTSTLLAGDLLTHVGQCPALTESDCVARALEAESFFHAAGLDPSTLAIMHGSSYSGDGAAQLRALADGYAAPSGAA